MKTKDTPVGQRNFITSILLVITAIFIFTNYVFSQTETLSTGFFIINMGIVFLTKSKVLKPFGLECSLLKTFETPVKRAISGTRVLDAIDYTHNGKYKQPKQ